MLQQLFLLLIGLGRLKVLSFDDIPELEYIKRSQKPEVGWKNEAQPSFF